MIPLMMTAMLIQPAADHSGGYDRPAKVSAEYTGGYDKPAPPDTRTPVVVTRTADGWRCEYRGAVMILPTTMPAAEVERRAGQWGMAVDTPPPDVPPAFAPASFPFRLTTTCAPGG